ncbi:MAG: 30S ribosomal protein S5 [Bacteroidia bacterium]|nr:30S ribosomal protein S5 [Bacteroidia bacterium]
MSLGVNTKRVKPTDSELSDRLVAVNRVAKVVKGGRRFGFSAIVVVGDQKGVVGHGLGKANEVTSAIAKGLDDAKKNLIKVTLKKIKDEGSTAQKYTIPHPVLVKYKSAKVLLRPAASGTGVLAGGSMRAVLESAGITDVLGKSLGSSSPHNVVKATLKALALLKDPSVIAKVRSVSLSKVFNG